MNDFSTSLNGTVLTKMMSGTMLIKVNLRAQLMF